MQNSGKSGYLYAEFNENVVWYVSPKWITGPPKVYKQLMYCPLVLDFLSSIWQMQNIWSADLWLTDNPQ
jgi:hypothetical protein